MELNHFEQIWNMIFNDTHSQSQDSQELKKILPEGTCLPREHTKYQYIHTFMKDPQVHRFIIPLSSSFSSFVIIKTKRSQGYPIYDLYYHPTQSFLLSAQHQSMNIGCNYIISTSKTPQKNQHFVAKLRGNFQRNQFHLYDNGDNPQRVKNKSRKHLAVIKKESKSIWQASDPKFMMIVPKPKQSTHQVNNVKKYDSKQFFCENSNPFPLLKDAEIQTNSVEILQYKEQEIRNKEKKISLQTSIKTQSITIQKKSDSYFQLGIGCPLTIIHGFGYFLALVQSESL